METNQEDIMLYREIRELYYKKQMSIPEIAKHLKTSKSSLHSLMIKLNIERRTISKGMKVHWKKNKNRIYSHIQEREKNEPKANKEKAM